MEIIGPFLLSLAAGLSTVLGSIVIFIKFKEEHIERFITFCLAFSLAIMIGISITELIPEASYFMIAEYSIAKGTIFSIGIFCIGIALILFFNKKMQKAKNSSSELYKLGILSMIALMLHNLPEGIATFMSAYKDMDLGLKLGIAIMLHNIPEGISIAVPIYYATKDKRKAISRTFLSGLAEPLGALLAYLFLGPFIQDVFISMVLLFVAGIMITLAIHEMFPKAIKYKENKWLLVGLISGFFLILLQYFLF